jgi:hypothetical protein
MLAVSVATLWGKMGGDEKFEYFHPELHNILHALHHWMFGLALICICSFFIWLRPIPIPVYFAMGMGVGLFLDDVMFHSFECYFQRKEC